MDDQVRRAVARRFARQHATAGRAQLFADGVSLDEDKRRVRDGTWPEVHEGVVRLAGAPATWRQQVAAATLSVPDGLASRRTAATLWGFPDARPGVIEVVTPRWDRRHRGFSVHETLDLAERDRAVVDGIPTLDAVRTWIDVCAVWSDDRVVEALDFIERQHLATVADVEVRFVELARKGRAGIARARRVLRARTGRVPESVFERRVDRLLERAGIRRPERQHPVVGPDGTVYRIDLAYPDLLIAIELDGIQFHGARRLVADDRRQTAFAVLGWRVLRFTWDDLVRRPEWVVACVAAAISAVLA
jgi:very-short-patch-repair endonuclease